jgi:hypothetical protein
MIQCLPRPVKTRPKARSGLCALTQTTPRLSGDLARAAQPARGVTGHHIALHADPAHIDTLVELLGIVGGIVRVDAKLLLRGVFRLLTARKTCRKCHQAQQTSPSHGTLSQARAFGPAVTRPDQTADFPITGRYSWFYKIVFTSSAHHGRPSSTSPTIKPYPPSRTIVTRFGKFNDGRARSCNINSGAACVLATAAHARMVQRIPAASGGSRAL